MGWTYQSAKYWKKGKIDRKRECDELFTQEAHTSESPFKKGVMIEYPKMEVVKSQMVGTTYYGAIKTTKNGVEEIWCAVCLTSTDGYDFGYKDMDETVMPYRFDCPKSILDLLSPTTNQDALKWRQMCYENLEKKKHSLAKLPIGSRIKVKMPYDTTYFHKDDEVVLIKMKRGYRSTYWVVQNGSCYFNRNLISSIERNCEIEILNGMA